MFSFGLPLWLRLTVIIVCVLVFVGALIAGILWPWPLAIALVMFAFGGKSDAQKKGYRW